MDLLLKDHGCEEWCAVCCPRPSKMPYHENIKLSLRVILVHSVFESTQDFPILLQIHNRRNQQDRQQKPGCHMMCFIVLSLLLQCINTSALWS